MIAPIRALLNGIQTPIVVRGTPTSNVDKTLISTVINKAARQLAYNHRLHYAPLDNILEGKLMWTADGM